MMLVDPDAVALALYRSLRQCDPNAFIEDFTLEGPVAVDGEFDLRALALILSVNLHGLAAQALAPVEQSRGEIIERLPQFAQATLL